MNLESLHEQIRNIRAEIDHLQNERRELRKVEKDMSRENYNRENESIQNHLQAQVEALENAENMINNITKARNLITDLRNLRDLSPRDFQDRDQINEEISAKENELRDTMGSIPEDLANEVRNSFLNNPENTNTSPTDTSDSSDNDSGDSTPTDADDNTNEQENTPTPSVDDNSNNPQEEEEEVVEEIGPTQEEIDQATRAMERDAERARINDGSMADTEEDIEEEINNNEETISNQQASNLDEEILQTQNDYFAADAELQASIRRMQDIFKEERERQENEGPFNNEELDAFQEDYMNRKIAENEVFLAAKRKKEALEAKLDQLYKQNNNTKSNKVNTSKQKKQDINKISGPTPEDVKGLPGPTPEDIIGLPGPTPEDVLALPGKTTPSTPSNPNNPNNPNNPIIPEQPEPTRSNPGDPTPPEPTPSEPNDHQDEPVDDNTNETHRKRGLYEILGEIHQGLDIKVKDDKWFNMSNIKVADNFKKEVTQGNYLYNIVSLPTAIVKAGFDTIGKIAGKIMSSKKTKEKIETMRERLDNLPAEDLETIFEEYRGTRVNQERYPKIFNQVIEEKMSEYILGKVTAYNVSIANSYQKVMDVQNQITALDEAMQNERLTPENKEALKRAKLELLESSTEAIKNIRNSKIEADKLLSGGLHGFSEDMKAAATKLNLVGKRFAKSHDIDHKLEDKLIELEKKENEAIETENDEALLQAFLESESTLSKNTEIKNSIFGKRSTGKKYYSPIAEQLDYRNDPFVTNLFRSVALTTAAIGAVNAIKVHAGEHDIGLENQRIIEEQKQTIEQARQYGMDITDKQSAFTEGMKSQINQDVLTSSGTVERATLDSTNWGLGTEAYRTADAAGHHFYNNYYQQTQGQISEIARQYSSGAINQGDALSQLANLSTQSHAALVNVTDKCHQILETYAKSNPQFDLGAFDSTMEHIISHPDAIANMNNAIVDIQNIGEKLASLSADQVAVIESLPSDLATTLLVTASSAALATQVSNIMGKKFGKKKGYGNTVTDMMNEYVKNTYGEEEENTNERTM